MGFVYLPNIKTTEVDTCNTNDKNTCMVNSKFYEEFATTRYPVYKEVLTGDGHGKVSYICYHMRDVITHPFTQLLT